MSSKEFVEYIIYDQLARLPEMSARAMFGGFGLYKSGTIVGIIIDGELYLKVDETNKKKYEAMGSTPFVYKRKDGKDTEMSYWKIPPEIIESSEELAALVEESYEINLKKAVEKKKPRR